MSLEVAKIFDPVSHMNFVVNDRLDSHDRFICEILDLDSNNKVKGRASYFLYPFNAQALALESLLDPEGILSASSDYVGHILFDKLKPSDEGPRKMQIRISQPGKVTILIDNNGRARYFFNMDIAKYRSLMMSLLLSTFEHRISKSIKTEIQLQMKQVIDHINQSNDEQYSRVLRCLDIPF